MKRALLATTLALASCIQRDPALPGPARSAAPNLDTARALDREGVVAFERGRYHDAVGYFREARRLGGPPSELWNEARCHERLDELEIAAQVIEDYVRQPGLTPDEKNEAQRELASLRARPSALLVTSAPPGAQIVVDDRPVGAITPADLEIAAGDHTIAVRKAGYDADSVPVRARFGRAVIVEIDLKPTAGH